MCNFFSCLVKKNGDILWDRNIDSHEDLVDLFELKDNNQFRPGFVRVEFTPPEDHELIGNVKKWNFNVDELVTPDWFDEESTKEKLQALVATFIVKKNTKLLTGGPWILVGKTKVDKAVNARIIAMYNSSQVGVMYDSSQVGGMYNFSQVGVMYDSSQVGVMYNFSQVGAMCGSSQVSAMRGSSQVGEMCDSSQVGKMYDSSRIITNNSTKKVVNGVGE